MLAILYKCKCMAAEASVEVPDRPAGGDLMLWMNVVQGTLGLDHSARSPRCLAAEMEYVKIPVDDGADGIGMKRPLQ
jgi:hypothetical protein